MSTPWFNYNSNESKDLCAEALKSGEYSDAEFSALGVCCDVFRKCEPNYAKFVEGTNKPRTLPPYFQNWIGLTDDKINKVSRAKTFSKAADSIVTKLSREQMDRMRETAAELLATIPSPRVSNDPAIQARYVELRNLGESHYIAEMCATKKPTCASGMDRHFWQNKLLNHGFETSDPSMPEILAEAKAAGISTAGKIYVGGLADHRAGADPMAWVSDIHDIRYVAKVRNRSVRGITNAEAEAPTQEVQGVRLAEDLVQQMMQLELQKNAGWATDLEGLREFVIDKYGSPK